MKILIIVLLLLINASCGFADTTDSITKKVELSLVKEFPHARIIKWENKKDVLIVTFSFNDEVMFASYTIDGHLLAVKRNILSGKLPITQLINLRKYFSKYWISDLAEVSIHHATVYYVTMENADSKLVLRSINHGSWQEYSRQEKNNGKTGFTRQPQSRLRLRDIDFPVSKLNSVKG